MKTVWKWVLFGLAIFFLAFFVALPFFGGGLLHAARGIGGSGWMMQGRMMGGLGLLGWFGLIAHCAVPAVILGLLVYLGIALLRRPAALPPPPVPPMATAPCAHCARPVEAGWVACPYCGKKV